MRRTLWPARIILALFTIIGTGVLAAPAAAAVPGAASVRATTVRFVAAWDAKNKVVITRAGRTVIIDDRVAIKPGKGCKRVKGDKTKVRCTTKKAPTLVTVDLLDYDDSVTNRSDLKLHAQGGLGNDTLVGGPKGDILQADVFWAPGGNDKVYGMGGNDTIIAGHGHDYVSGGDGNDHLDGECPCADSGITGNDVMYGGNGNDYLTGSLGNDKLYGGNGNDSLSGSVGRDLLDGGAGNDELDGDYDSGTAAADVFRGGPGHDVVSYFAYTKAITVDLDGATGDDGIRGERDTVGADVEGIWGGYGNDRLVGNRADNEIEGRRGNDVILGGAGNDRLTDDHGRNKLYGEAGQDTLTTWNSDNNLVDGGAHADLCQATRTDILISCEQLHLY